MSVLIDANILGIKKPIEVKTSQKNVRAAAAYMRDVAQYDVDKNELPDEETNANLVAFLDTQIGAMDATSKFVSQTLQLTEKQAEKLEDLTFGEAENFAIEIVSKVMGIGPNPKATEQDLKSDANPTTV
ncbi:phage tail tube assembly chaperone [Lactobacillus acetotolerans]|uniref:phage tail tube assembly chaperone n=1 Tax=Lactobacillus acetotolerans TaxID=1600 RepID=UPI002FD892E5